MPKKKSVQKRTADQATISSFFKPLPADLTKPKIPNKVRSQPSVVVFKETVTKADKGESALPELDENDPQWAMLYRRVGSTEGVGTTMAEHILRWFDRSSQYGPGVGSQRLERWKRAKMLNLNPPEEVRQILETRQGKEDIRLNAHGISF